MSLSISNIVKKGLNNLGIDIRRKKDFKELVVYYKWIAHLLYFKEVYDLIKNVDGDIVECGIGHGHSFFKICCLAQYEGKERSIFGFDSFEGFPLPTSEDKSDRNPKKGEWKVATIESTTKVLTEGGMLDKKFIKDRVVFIKGFFEDSLPKYNGKEVAFLHLDVDLYRSYKTTLEYFWPKMAKGGVILFDEYKQSGSIEKFPGAAKAINEFFGDNISEMKYNSQANRYFIQKR